MGFGTCNYSLEREELGSHSSEPGVFGSLQGLGGG